MNSQMARMKRLLVVLGLGLSVASFAAGLSGCGPPARLASAADLERLGTRQYPRPPKDVRRAIVTSLKLQGYDVVTDAPRVRTAPKPIALHAVGGRGRAVGFDETMAWDIDVQASPQGSTVRAHLRGQINGQPMSSLYYDYVERNCRALFADVDESLGPVR